MQSYFLEATARQQNLLRTAQISFAPFQNGRQKGIVFDDTHLPQALATLRSAVERSEKSQYEGVQVLHLKRARNAAATATPATPATVTVENWPNWAGSGSKALFKSIVEEFAASFGVREIKLVGNESRHTSNRPQTDNSKFNIWMWSGPQGNAGDATSADQLWGHRISSERGNWTIWKPSGLGVTIADDCSEPVAELVGNNLYVFYSLNSSELRENIIRPVLRRILEETLLLLGTAPEELVKRRLELQRQRDEQLQAEAKANPVVVKRWGSDGSNSLRDKFIAITKDFAQAFGGKPIWIYNYCDDTQQHRPSTDGRVNICIWSSSDDINGDGKMRPRLFGAPLAWEDNCDVLRPTGGTGTLLTDEDGNQVGKVMDDTIYIHYPLTKRYLNLKWDGKGPDALFRRILEEVVFVKTATPEQKAARARVIAEKHRAQSREGYVQACNGRFDAIIGESRKAIERNPQQVRELQQSIVKLIRETGEAQKRVQQMEGSRAEAMAAYAKEFDKLLTVPKIVDVRVADNTIRVFTEILYCVDPRSKKRHEIGAFRIELGVNGKVHWFNLTRRVDGYKGGMQAPHVFPSGEACLGNMEEVIPQLVANYEFAALAMVAIQFIENVNVDDPAGRCVNQWPIAA